MKMLNEREMGRLKQDILHVENEITNIKDRKSGLAVRQHFRPLKIVVRLLGRSFPRQSIARRDESANQMGSAGVGSVAGGIRAEGRRRHGVDEVHSARRGQSQSMLAHGSVHALMRVFSPRN